MRERSCSLIFAALASTYKGLGVGKGLGHQALWFFEDLSNVLGTVGVALLVREEVERLLAASLSTARVALGEAIDAHSSTAGGLVQLVHAGAVVIVNVVLGDAAVLSSFH